MMYTLIKPWFLTILTIVISVSVFSQQQLIPYVKNYSKLDYNGDALVWSITRTSDNLMYFANNRYLLEFDGKRWRKFVLPKKTVIRSVFAKEDKIYTGSYQEFGFWKWEENELKYHSISENFTLFNENQSEEIWNILDYDGKIIFQSFSSIYVYDGESIKKYKTPSQISYAFNIEGKLFLASMNDGIIRFENGKFYNESKFEKLKNTVIHSILSLEGKIIFFTQKLGIYIWENGELKAWENKLNENLKEDFIHSAIKVSKDHVAIGTVNNGLYIVNLKNGNFTSFNRNNGSLQNNSVQCLYMDIEKNLWLGLDNGISKIENDGNVFIYQDFTGKLGSVLSIQKTKDGFLLGSNHGLYKLEKGQLEIIHNSQGPVWNIFPWKNKFLIGHNDGTFILEDGQLEKVTPISGGYLIKESESREIYQSSYSGIYKYQIKSPNFQWQSIAKNLHKPINNFVFDHKAIWGADTYRGLYKIDVQSKKFEEIKTQTNQQLYNAKIAIINEKPYFLSNRIWYEYDTWSNQLIESKKLNELLPNLDDIITLSHAVFLVNSNQMLSLAVIKNNSVVWQNIPYKYYEGKLVNDITTAFIKDNFLYLNLDNGFLKYKIDFDRKDSKYIHLEALSNKSLLKNNSKLGYYNNAIEFFVSSRKYGFDQEDYYFKLTPLEPRYSLINSGKVSYTHLTNGKYTFKVAKKVGTHFVEMDSFSFIVKKPWFISNLMVVFYLLIIFLTYFLYHQFLQRQTKSKFKQLENEVMLQKELVKVKNEAENKENQHWLEKQKLEHDIKNKTSELASRALSITTQNELLTDLESILKNIDNTTPIQKVKHSLNKILKDYNYSQNEWKVFDTNLHELHEDFVSRLIKTYSDLSPKDIRLAILLRMNMTSKEIAPLMQKSFRSVELQRYRLRKKMNLSSKINLSKFFINF